jgi:hypothetical protein
MQERGHYSPDGRWWWNGSRWVAVSQRHESDGSSGTSRSVVWPILSGLVIVLVAGAGVLSFLVTTRLGALGLSFPGTNGSYSAADVTTLLKASGFECSLGYTAPVKVHFCFQTRAHDYADVGIQVRGQDQTGWVNATVARNGAADPDVTPRATKLVTVLAQIIAGPSKTSAAASWAQQTMKSPGDVGTFGNVQMQVQKLPDADQQAMYQFDASVAGTQKTSIPGTQLKGVAEKQVQGYFEQRGLTCADQGGIIACAKSSGDANFKGTILPDDTGSGVRLFFAGVLPGSGDRTPLARDLFTGAVRLGMQGDDATNGVAWVESHLDGGWHDTVMNGVHLAVSPESRGRNMRQGGGADVWLGTWPW